MNKIRKTLLLSIFAASVLSACTGNNGTKNDNDIEVFPDATYTVKSGLKEYKYNNKINVSDFEIKDLDGNVMSSSDFKIENFDKQLPGEQIVKFTNNDDSSKYEYYRLTLKRRDSLKVLIVGNSWGQDTLKFCWKIATSAGYEDKDIHFVNMYVGGCSIARHIELANGNQPVYVLEQYKEKEQKSSQATLKDGILLDNWDYIVLHPQAFDFDEPNLTKDLETLKNYCLDLCSNKNVKFAYDITWAHSIESDNVTFIDRYDSEPEKMFLANIETVKNKVAKLDFLDMILPSGTVIQNARTSYLGDKLHRDSGTHLNDYGKFFVGSAFLSKMMGFSVDEITFRNNKIDDKTYNLMCKCVKSALLNPYKITNIEE